MPHVLKLKDGRLITPIDARDVLESIEECAGEEVRRYMEEYLEENMQEAVDFEAQAAEYEKELEQQAEHYRSVLCDIREEVEALDILFQEKRLNRARMQKAVKVLYQKVNRDL